MAYTAASDLVQRIARYGTEALRGEHLRLAGLSQSIPALARNRVIQEKMELSRLSQSIPALVQGRVARQRVYLTDYAGKLQRGIDARIHAEQKLIARAALMLENRSGSLIQRERLRLQRFDDMLRLLSPDNTLRRGYSITRVNGHAISDASKISPGTTVETTLASGKIISISK